MSMSTRRIALAALAATAVTALAAASMPATAQAPATAATPLRLIVPFTPGTGIDLIARQVGPHLSTRLGRPVVVDNRPGASGNLGTEAVVRAAPDGNTLLVTVNTLVMNRALFPRLGFDPLRDLEPVALTSWGQLLLVTSKASGLSTPAALLARARARPGALNYASPGNGTPHHLAMELLKNQARVFITHIPYRGTAQAVTDILGGQVDVMFLPIHVALQHVKSGRLHALAISSDTPHPLLPEVAPLRALQLGDGNVDMWFGLLAPAGTPKAIIERINLELKAILALPEVSQALQTQGMSPAHGSADEFRALIQRDAERWARVVRAQSIQPD
jgi:tripartite-type tricarboxylate transporter receptor subunit TctC